MKERSKRRNPAARGQGENGVQKPPDHEVQSQAMTPLVARSLITRSDPILFTPLAVEVSVARWCKDGHVGVGLLRYSQGDRERVANLVRALSPTTISTHPDHVTSTLTAVGS